MLAPLARFHVLLERGDACGHLLACFPADHQRHKIFPMLWPVKSTLMVRRDLESATGSTRTSTAARIGRSMPRTPQVRGGSICTSSDVHGRLAPPMRRLVTHLATTAGVWALADCHA